MSYAYRGVPGATPELLDAPENIDVYLLGLRIDRLRLAGLLSLASAAARRRVRTTILYVNVHCLNVSQADPAYRDILRRADVVYCDGTGVRLGARLAGQSLPERMTGADWIDDLCRVAVRDNLSLFLVAGQPDVAAAAATLLRIKHPGLRVAGTAPGYGAGASVIAAINASRPDIVLVGMGTPTQEKWIATHRQDLQVPVVWAVGALFDFVTGRIPRGPRWLTNHGLEWLCRLVAEPRKLWRRYLIGNPLFFARVLRATLQRRHHAA